MRVTAAVVVAIMCSCVGPEALDAAVCRDTIHRLCVADCPQVRSVLSVGSGVGSGVGSDCEETLITRTGCGTDDFSFSSPTRERFLACRSPLVKSNASTMYTPTCDEVASAFSTCSELATFFGPKVTP